jgi:hypothetical protein
MSDQGVLTACNNSPLFERSLPTLVQSCTQKGVPITVVDQGLSPEQRETIASMGANVVKMDVNYDKSMGMISKGHRGHPLAPSEAWWKPLVCLQTPYLRTIWIDSDAILLRGQDEMFAAIGDRGWITRDWWDYWLERPQRMERLYGAVIKAYHGKAFDPKILRQRCYVNSGVFGFMRGAQWVDEWAHTCGKIIASKHLLKLCNCRDQSGLAVWLATGPEAAPPFIEDERWNYPANGLNCREVAKRKKYEGDNLLEQLEADHPEAYVAHFLGRPKM